MDGSHELGDRFQRLFLDRVNQNLPVGSQLPNTGYQVAQEVNTAGPGEIGMDIADILLSRPDACVVVENFGTSEGHGHDFHRYLAHGTAGGRRASVVLLCITHEPLLQKDGWSDAVVCTYDVLLRDLQQITSQDRAWRHSHSQQAFFLDQLFQHFLGGSSTMSLDQRLAFIRSMCETGESVRFGHQPHEVAAQEFANLVAQHAKQQFHEARTTLAQVKKQLKVYATQALTGQVNDRLAVEGITQVEARFSGQWEWCVTLRGAEARPAVYLEFGPTAVVENTRVANPVANPDYSTIFVTREAPHGAGIDRILPTSVSLEEVITGLRADDRRIPDAVIAILGDG